MSRRLRGPLPRRGRPVGLRDERLRARKYAAHARRAAATGPFARALELGGSIGVFSALLAPRCDAAAGRSTRAPTAVAAARARLAALSARARRSVGAIPDDLPRRPVRPRRRQRGPLLPRRRRARRARSRWLADGARARRPPRRRALAPAPRRTCPLTRRRTSTAALARAPGLRPVDAERARRVPPRRARAPVSRAAAWSSSAAAPPAHAAAEAYRDAGGAGAVALVAAEGRLPYNRPPLSKELLRGEIGERRAAARGRRLVRASEDVELRGGAAAALDAGERAVALADGEVLAYDTLRARHGRRAGPAAGRGRRRPGRPRAAQRRRPAPPAARAASRRSAGRRVGSGFIGCEAAGLAARARLPRSRSSARSRRRSAARLGAEVGGAARRLARGGGRRAAARRRGRADRAGDAALRVAHGAGPREGDLVLLATGLAPAHRARRGRRRSRSPTTARSPSTRTMRTRATACSPAATARSRTTPPPGRPLHVEHWGDALAQGEVAGRTAAGERRGVGRRARLLVHDRRAHAQVRRVGRRLRRGPRRGTATARFTAWYGARRPLRRRARARARRGLRARPRPDRARARRCRERAPGRRRRPRARRGGAHRRLPRGAGRAARLDPRGVRGHRRARPLPRRDGAGRRRRRRRAGPTCGCVVGGPGAGVGRRAARRAWTSRRRAARCRPAPTA